MAQYADYFVIAGLALCAVSVIYAVIQLVQLQPPRAAAITLILGIVLLFLGALASPQSFTMAEIRGAWGRVTGQDQQATTTNDEESAVKK